MPKRYLDGSSIVLEGEEISAILIEEGRSKNGNVWTKQALEDIARLAPGTPINVYDFSRNRDGSNLSHFEFLRQRLPPGIRDLLDEKLAGAKGATIKSATVESGDDGRQHVRAKIELEGESSGFLRRVIQAATKLGRKLGLSIHVPVGGMTSRTLAAFGRQISGVGRIVGFDTVTQPSAGGRILPVLEALALRRSVPMKKFIERLLRLVSEEKRPALEALLTDALKAIEKPEELLVEEHEDFAEALLEALDLGELEGEAGPVLEALARHAPEPAKKKKTAKKKAPPRRPPVVDPEADPDGAGALEGLQAAQTATEEQLAEILLENGRDLIEAGIEKAELPEGLAKFAAARLTATLESEGKITRKTIDAFVSDLKKSLGKGQAKGGGLLDGDDGNGNGRTPHYAQAWSQGEAAAAALEAMLSGEREGIIRDDAGKEVGRVPAFTGPRQMWAVVMDDPLLEGERLLRRRRTGIPPVLEAITNAGGWDDNPYMAQVIGRRTGAAALEAIITTGFTALLADQMNKRLAREYAKLAHLWKMVSTTTSVSDFRARRIVRLGEYSNLIDVAEDAAYSPGADLTDFTEESVQATVVKRGGIAFISWESIVNDDLRGFRAIPRKLANAAERTLNSLVWGRLLNNDAWDEDATAVFHATHGNLAAVAYSFAALEAARLAMTRQKDMDAREAGRILARNVFVGPLLHDTVYSDLFSDGAPNLLTSDTNAVAGTPNTGTIENRGKVNVLRSKHGWNLFEVHEFDEVVGKDDDVIVAASPGETEIIEVGFLNGREDPEIFVQDLERVGSFFDQDRITYKVRHVHDGGEIVDYRGVYSMIAP